MPTPFSLGQVPESWQDLNRDVNCQKFPLLCYSLAVFLARSLFALFRGLRFVDLPLSLFLSLIHTLSCFSTIAIFSLSRVLSLCELWRFSLLCLFFGCEAVKLLFLVKELSSFYRAQDFLYSWTFCLLVYKIIFEEFADCRVVHVCWFCVSYTHTLSLFRML
jgi:hypothetical protein